MMSFKSHTSSYSLVFTNKKNDIQEAELGNMA